MPQETGLVPYRLEPQIENLAIVWQVYERLYPDAPNLYEVAERVVFDINQLVNQPGLSAEDRWLFEPKNGQPPDIAFMTFANHQKIPTALIFDEQFSIHAMSVGRNVIAVPLGRTHEVIYRSYMNAKFGQGRKIPPLPQDFIQGFLVQSAEGFSLSSIFHQGWDARKKYDTALAVRGCPTRTYDDIAFLGHIGGVFRKDLIDKIIQKHHLPEAIRPQLESFTN